MAIYHLTTKHISRKSGRTATAAAAYRAAAMIHDERTGETHDYTKKGGVLSANCFYVDANGDVNHLDREQVWNAAEQTEKRKDARTAREIVIALPSEMNEQERYALAGGFGEWLSKKFGVGVDVALHAPDKDGDQRNFHAHILMTTRKIALDADGKVILGDKSDLELSDRDLRKRYGADASGKKFVNEIRKNWADGTNRYLEQVGLLDVSIDHRSHAERGLKELPTIKLGVAASAMERRGEISERGEINRAIRAANAQYREVQKEIEQAQAHEHDRTKQFIDATDREIEIAGQRIDGISADFERRKRKPTSSDFDIGAAHRHAAAGINQDQAGIENSAGQSELAYSGRQADGQSAGGFAGADKHIDDTARHIDSTAQDIERTKQFIDEVNARARATARDIEILDTLNQREIQPTVAPQPVIISLPLTASYIPGGFNRPLYQKPTLAIGHYKGYKEFQSGNAHTGQVDIDLTTMQIVSENITTRYPEQYRDTFSQLIKNHAYGFLGRDDQGNDTIGFDRYNNYIKYQHGTSFQCDQSFHDDINRAFEYLQRTPPQVQQVQQPHQERSRDYDYDR